MKAILKPIREDITYDEIDRDVGKLWNFLFFTGYLKNVGFGDTGKNGEIAAELSIPNTELMYIYNIAFCKKSYEVRKGL